jgi:hypothetical protein
MPHDVQIVGYSRDTGQPAFEMIAEWWNAGGLMNDPRFKQAMQTSYAYLDYFADLSVKEVRVLHERFRAVAANTSYISQKLTELDSVLNTRSDKFSHFQIRILEWESGLD